MNKRQNRLLIILISLFIFSLSACKNNSSDPLTVVNNSIPEIKEVIEPQEIKHKIKSLLDSNLWAEIHSGENNILVEMRYASEDNFMNKKVYPCSRCFFRPVVAQKIIEIADILAKQDLRIKLLDCYRPAHFQHELWNAVPDWRYVAPPIKGSMHGRGLGVDLTLCDTMGKELNMGTPYDYFGRETRHDYLDYPLNILENRKKIKTAMIDAGFIAGRSEWWHYSFPAKFPLDSIVWNCDSLETETP